MLIVVINFVDGLEHTRHWLLKHLNTNEAPPANVVYDNYIRNVAKKTFSEACIDLLDWDPNSPFPEVSLLFLKCKCYFALICACL